MNVTRTESGLLVVGKPQPPPKPKPANPIKCDVCGKIGEREFNAFGGGFWEDDARTRYWHHHNWCCNHGATYSCPDCVATGCPVCSEQCAYT